MQDSRGSGDSHAIAYRADIDGLRAVAVVSVIVYHLNRTLLPGGYLGVDIFFVISGFLITSILWTECLTGRFSLAKFYERRLRRIMPALLLMLIVCTAVASTILLPIDLVRFGESVLATLAFGANIYFWRDSGYFSPIAEEKPLLHMWSLGVEEQFYILFPLILFGIARFWRRGAPLLIMVLVLVSFIADIGLVYSGGETPAFYLLPTRAWELAAGALLAVVPHATLKTAAIRQAAALAGVGLIALALAVGLNNPFWFAPTPLAAVVGVCLLILAGRRPNLFSWLLSRRPVVLIGLISYSLYLWHWPWIVFGKYYLVRDFDLSESVAVVALTIVCALISYQVERRFRSKSIGLRTVGLWVLGGAGMVTACAAIFMTLGGLPGRFPAEEARMNAVVGTHYRCPVSGYLVLDTSRACTMNLPTRNPADADVALVGNSHAQMYAPLVQEIIEKQGLKGLLVNANACWPMSNVNISVYCASVAEQYLSAVAKLTNIKLVIIAFNWLPDEQIFVSPTGSRLDLDLSNAIIMGLANTINMMESAGKRVVLIGPISVPGWDIASVASRSLAFGRPVHSPLFETASSFQDKYMSAISYFQTRKDITFIRPDAVECSDAKCDFIRDGVPLFSDSSHLAQSELGLFKTIFQQGISAALARQS